MTDSESKQVGLEIPLEARMSFIDRTQSNSEWINARAIAEAIGTYDRWVYRSVKDLGIQSEVRFNNGVEIAMYPPWTVDILREELQWSEHLRELPNELSVGEVSESLGRSRGWTQKTLEDNGIQPVRKSGSVKYNKRALKELRHISMTVPLDDGWYNLQQLVELTGQDREWIERRIIESGYESSERRSALTGKIHQYFPPDALNIVTNAMAERAAAAGEWMTAYGIAKRIGRNEKWVNSRVSGYQEQSQTRQDDMGVTRVHYPPSVLDALEIESERNKLLPERGDYLNVHEVARMAGHGTEWAERRLVLMGIEPELRKDKKGRAQLCYPPSTVKLLIDNEKENPEQDKNVSAESIRDAHVAVESLRSKIRQKKESTKEPRRMTVDDIGKGHQFSERDMKELRRELKLAAQRLYRLQAKADKQANVVNKVEE